MRALMSSVLLVLLACGGDSSGPSFNGLPQGTYAAYSPPPSGGNWLGSWPAGTARTDCAYIGGSVTIVDRTTFTETRSYGTAPGAPNPLFTSRTFTGSYAPIPDKGTFAFSVDGAIDTVSAQSSFYSPGRDALVMHRVFPLRGGCTTGGPYTIEYIK